MRKLLPLVAGPLLFLSLTGCGGASAPSPVPSETPSPTVLASETPTPTATPAVNPTIEKLSGLERTTEVEGLPAVVQANYQALLDNQGSLWNWFKDGYTKPLKAVDNEGSLASDNQKANAFPIFVNGKLDHVLTQVWTGSDTANAVSSDGTEYYFYGQLTPAAIDPALEKSLDTFLGYLLYKAKDSTGQQLPQWDREADGSYTVSSSLSGEPHYFKFPDAVKIDSCSGSLASYSCSVENTAKDRIVVAGSSTTQTRRYYGKIDISDDNRPLFQPDLS